MIYGAILTDRNRLAPSTIKQSIKTLENEEVLGIFPEGGMKGFELAPAKPGAVYLSAMRHVQEVPIGVHGGNQAWVNIFRGVRSRIKINIGKAFGPLEITGSKNEKKTQIRKSKYEHCLTKNYYLNKNRFFFIQAWVSCGACPQGLFVLHKK